MRITYLTKYFLSQAWLKSYAKTTFRYYGKNFPAWPGDLKNNYVVINDTSGN